MFLKIELPTRRSLRSPSVQPFLGSNPAFSVSNVGNNVSFTSFLKTIPNQVDRDIFSNGTKTTFSSFDAVFK
jgi:hypothetical protein